MKKKNFFWSVLAVMMVTMLSVNLSACSSDDDDNNDASGVIGTWVMEYEDESYRAIDTIVFKANKSGTWTITEENKKNSHIDRDTYSFTYTPTSSTEGIIAIEEDGSYGKDIEYMYYVIKNNKLYVSQYYEEDGHHSENYEVFTKQ